MPAPAYTEHTWHDLAAWGQSESPNSPHQLWLVETGWQRKSPPRVTVETGWPQRPPSRVTVRTRCYSLDVNSPSPLLLGAS